MGNTVEFKTGFDNDMRVISQNHTILEKFRRDYVDKYSPNEENAVSIDYKNNELYIEEGLFTLKHQHIIVIMDWMSIKYPEYKEIHFANTPRNTFCDDQSFSIIFKRSSNNQKNNGNDDKDNGNNDQKEIEIICDKSKNQNETDKIQHNIKIDDKGKEIEKQTNQINDNNGNKKKK